MLLQCSLGLDFSHCFQYLGQKRLQNFPTAIVSRPVKFLLPTKCIGCFSDPGKNYRSLKPPFLIDRSVGFPTFLSQDKVISQMFQKIEI